MPNFWPIAVAIAAASALPAHALQILDGRDGVTVQGSISLKEPTRIKIEGAAITDVFGNVYASNCGSSPAPANVPGGNGPAINASGEVILECDRDKGEIFIKPVGHGTKPINLFVSTATATYTLLLSRVDMPADTIVIKDRTLGAKRPRNGDAGGRSTGSGHVRGLKALLAAMASPNPSSDFRVEDANRPVRLWKEADLALVRVVEGRGLIGEVYRLTNVSLEPMVLAEEEFDRDGANVVAVSIESHNLRPGDSTAVYVLRAEM